MAYGKAGGRLPDPGMGAICARCGEPRGVHGGPRKLGNCPDQSGLRGRRFALREEDKPERLGPPPMGKPNRAFRLPEVGLWDRFGRVARPDRSTVLREFIAWYVRDEGAKLPRRPESANRSATPDHGESSSHSAA